MNEHSRTYPIFPIPAVGAIILNGERVLLVQRGQAPAKGQWTFPGGVLEVGESPEDALKREIREECCLDITIHKIVEVVNKVIRDEQQRVMYHYLILDYLAYPEPEGISNAPQPGSDVMDVRWIPIGDMASYDVTEGVHEVLQKAVNMDAGRKSPCDNRSG